MFCYRALRLGTSTAATRHVAVTLTASGAGTLLRLFRPPNLTVLHEMRAARCRCEGCCGEHSGVGGPSPAGNPSTLTARVDEGVSTAFKTFSIDTQNPTGLFQLTDASGDTKNAGTIDITGTTALISDSLLRAERR